MQLYYELLIQLTTLINLIHLHLTLYQHSYIPQMVFRFFKLTASVFPDVSVTLTLVLWADIQLICDAMKTVYISCMHSHIYTKVDVCIIYIIYISSFMYMHLFLDCSSCCTIFPSYIQSCSTLCKVICSLQPSCAQKHNITFAARRQTNKELFATLIFQWFTL